MSIEKGGPTGPDNKKDSLEKLESQEGRIKGTIKRWNAEKGFGFLRLSDGREVFCHVSELCEHIRSPRGEAPDISSPVNVKKVNQRERGLAAEEVECDACAAPEQWELQPFGPEIFGVRELQPVCVNKSNVSSYNSTIPREEVERVNEPFKLAKRKETLWNWSIIEDEFFREFGEPQGIRVEDENKIVLSYPHGEKIVSADSAMNSKHWEVSPSGQWKEEDESIKAEFIFPDIFGAKVWRTVASLYINPSLHKEFDLLPESAQQEVLAKVKEKILPPADIAEKRFNDFLNEDYRKKEISKLRDDLRSLQAPGESFVSSSTHKAQFYEPLSPDERRGDFYYEGSITTYSLTVGARKKEQSHWSGDYQGGKSFVVASSEYARAPKETAEQLRDKLITEKRQQLKSEFDRAKKMNPPSSDPRLYSLDSEEWSRQYEARWDEMQKAIEDQWEIEDAQLLGETKQSYEQYENIAKDLLATREEVEQAERLARVSRVPLEYNARPDWGNIGSDTVEKMQEQVTALRTYAIKLNEHIPNAVRAREQEFQTEKAVREEEERQKKAKEEADIEQFGTTGRLLEVARSLATEAEQRLGSDRAQALFQDTSTAPYGRARRQADIGETLGKDITQEAQSFYNFFRSRDVNAVLYAVTRILGGTDVSTKTSSQSVKPSPESPVSESTSPREVKIEELPRLDLVDKKRWWSHELTNGIKHSDKLNKTDKTAYEAGERINVRCPSCPDNPLVGYLQK